MTETTESDKPVIAKNYRFVRGEQPRIDGTLLPWWVADCGPYVDDAGYMGLMHVLWVPIICEGGLNGGGPPGESLLQMLADAWAEGADAGLADGQGAAVLPRNPYMEGHA